MQDTITLTPMQLQSIVREVANIGHRIKDVRISRHVGTIALVTLDAGYGTYSFYVHVGGKVVQAGMGESVERYEGEREAQDAVARGVWDES